MRLQIYPSFILGGEEWKLNYPKWWWRVESDYPKSGEEWKVIIPKVVKSGKWLSQKWWRVESDYPIGGEKWKVIIPFGGEEWKVIIPIGGDKWKVIIPIGVGGIRWLWAILHSWLVLLIGHIS